MTVGISLGRPVSADFDFRPDWGLVFHRVDCQVQAPSRPVSNPDPEESAALAETRSADSGAAWLSFRLFRCYLFLDATSVRKPRIP
jgi:hypothetical protein